MGAYTAAVDSGVPQTSKRTGTQVEGAVAKGTAGKAKAKAKTADANGTSTRSSGNGSARSGPVDPRTEDASSPNGLSRAGKTLWRRPGAALSPPQDKQTDGANPDAPVDFVVATPLAPAETHEPIAGVVPAAPDVVAPVVIAPAWGLSSTIAPARAPKTVAPVTDAPTMKAPTTTDEPTALVPTELAPSVAPPEADAPEADATVQAPILYDQAATIDDVTQIGPVLDSRPLLRPIQFRRAPKPRVRRVTRVVRHVDTWSVFKVAMVFSVFFYAVALVAGVLLWQVAYATGTIDNVEKFFEGFGWETFKFNGGQIYHNAWIAGLFLAVGLTGLAVLMATLFNLITDLVGGIRLSVLEEEVRSRAERGTESSPAAVVVAEPEPVPVAPWAAAPVDVNLGDDALPVESDSARPVA
jgi:hypothetical protein